MSRIIYAEKLEDIKQLHLLDPKALGPMLGILVIEGRVPVQAVSELLNVSRPTVYRWMYGYSCPHDKDKIVKIQILLTILRKAKRARDLPLEGNMEERMRLIGIIAVTHMPIDRTAKN